MLGLARSSEMAFLGEMALCMHTFCGMATKELTVEEEEQSAVG
jgi:hypothetical protein